MDLYEVLGVPRDATVEVIRKGYKSKARANHPDHGGDAEKMKSVNHAWEILSDPEKKELYDLTGTDSPEMAKHVEGNLLTLFEEYLNQEEEFRGDLMAKMREIVCQSINTMEQEAGAARRRVVKLERDRARIKGPGLFAKAADRSISACKGVIARNEKNIEIAELMLVALKKYADSRPPDVKPSDPYSFIHITLR